MDGRQTLILSCNDNLVYIMFYTYLTVNLSRAGRGRYLDFPLELIRIGIILMQTNSNTPLQINSNVYCYFQRMKQDQSLGIVYMIIRVYNNNMEIWNKNENFSWLIRAIFRDNNLVTELWKRRIWEIEFDFEIVCLVR